MCDRHTLVGGGGHGQSRSQCRPPVVTNWRVQSEKSLSFCGVLAAIRFALAICDQRIRINANLRGDEIDQRHRWRFPIFKRATNMAQITELYCKAETVVSGALGQN